MHVHSIWHDAGVELVADVLLLGVVGGDPEDAFSAARPPWS
jgi:hypothetical protein